MTGSKAKGPRRKPWPFPRFGRLEPVPSQPPGLSPVTLRGEEASFGGPLHPALYTAEHGLVWVPLAAVPASERPCWQPSLCHSDGPVVKESRGRVRG
jgi:hypothetical protein